LFTSPENIFYLTGLDHQGYFGPHILVLPKDDEMVLLARAPEWPTIQRQVGNARFQGYSDTEEPGSAVCRTLLDAGLGRATVGVQRASLFFPPTIADSLAAGLPDVQWHDASGIVEDLRHTKSQRELGYVRRAAAVSDAMVQRATAAAAEGASEKEIAASAHEAMILAGGEPPGFGPFIRSGERLPYEHEVWSDRALGKGEQLFLEMAGCVARYHAPMGRLLFVGEAPDGTREVEVICREAQKRVIDAMRPGVTGADVYRAWQDEVDCAGLDHYRRHHCGYSVGIAFPPSWTGGIGVVSLHPESKMVLRSGMVFHQLSWLLGCGLGDYFVSDTVIVTGDGCELATQTSRDLTVV
jgi:Xaa-Pro dipeptidase